MLSEGFSRQLSLFSERTPRRCSMCLLQADSTAVKGEEEVVCWIKKTKRGKLYKIEALSKAANKHTCTCAHTHTHVVSLLSSLWKTHREVGNTRLPLFDFFAVVSQSPCWKARCPAGSSAGRPRSWTPATTRRGWRSPLAGPPPRIWTWALGISVQCKCRKWASERKTDF